MNKQYSDLIAYEFRECVQNTILRLEATPTHRPFHEALLSDEALLWSRFERSFSTSFGQRVIEKISKYIALAFGADVAETQRETTCTVSRIQLAAIDEHIRSLRESTLGRAANWQQDLRGLIDVIGEDDGVQRVISDLWFERDGVQNYISIKTVKPNIDQTAEAKRDLLKLKLSLPESNVYFGLYYNPYGDTREEYDWGPPNRIFDMHRDEVVLIGKDYWETIGGEGAYEEILQIAQEVGQETRVLLGA